MKKFGFLFVSLALLLGLSLGVSTPVSATGTATVQITNNTDMMMYVQVDGQGIVSVASNSSDILPIVDGLIISDGRQIIVDGGSHTFTAFNSDMMMLLQTDMMMQAGHEYDMMMTNNPSFDMMMTEVTH